MIKSLLIKEMVHKLEEMKKWYTKMETMVLHKKLKIDIKLSSPHKIFRINNLIVIMAANKQIL